jgi:hypothetical protein
LRNPRADGEHLIILWLVIIMESGVMAAFNLDCFMTAITCSSASNIFLMAFGAFIFLSSLFIGSS